MVLVRAVFITSNIEENSCNCRSRALACGILREVKDEVSQSAGKQSPNNVVIKWGLSNISSSRIGGLRRACAELARAVSLAMVFAQAHHTKTNTMNVFEPLRQPCAVLARAGLLTSYVILGFR